MLLSVAFKQIWALLVPVQRILLFLEGHVAIYSARERVVFVAKTALSMIVAFFVVAAFIPVIIQIIMSASSLLNRLGAVAIAEISRPGINLSHVLSIHLLPMSKRRLNSP
jgi:hypothetical protein